MKLVMVKKGWYEIYEKGELLHVIKKKTRPVNRPWKCERYWCLDDKKHVYHPSLRVVLMVLDYQEYENYPGPFHVLKGTRM